MVLRMENLQAEPVTEIKRKRDSKILTNSNIKPPSGSPQRKKMKSKKESSPLLKKELNVKACLDHIVNIPEGKKATEDVSEDISKRYPVLYNQDLIQKFLSVPMTNNQKGRIRQLLRDSLKGTSEFLLPDVIHNRIQSILKSLDTLSESELRKIRILHNMLKTAVAAEKSPASTQKKKNKKTKKKVEILEVTDIMSNEEKKDNTDIKIEQGDAKRTIKSANKTKLKKSTEESKIVKPKGPKRYVVFLGNLPLDIDKDKIMQHFSEFNECIVDIRLPKRAEGKKSSIAYVELKNEPTYELALSKHHSMLGNKRINVLYTAQKNGKVTKTEAKSKSAKLIAMQKAGKLIGSIPVNRKRSHRRMKMKRAQAKLEAETTLNT